MSTAPAQAKLNLDRALFVPGDRVAVAVSGGADSVALLRAMLDAAQEIGLALMVVHVHHGLRGADADADANFVRELAGKYQLHLELVHVDTRARVEKTGESVEQAARHLRYEAFHRLLHSDEIDAVATAHTLDDQAETVLMKFLRGAWTEGLSGIHPVVRVPQTEGRIVRPLLNVRRVEIEAYLRSLGQPWREDASNADTAFTRNRVRHELLPLLRRDYNPGIDRQLAQMAVIARDEEARWQTELARLLPSLLLPGSAARGGGRSTSTLAQEKSVSIEIPRLRTLDPALRRRVIRAAAEHIGACLDFAETESILNLCLREQARSGARLTLAAGLIAERTPRELRLSKAPSTQASPLSADEPTATSTTYTLPIPGEVVAAAFELRFTAAADVAGAASPGSDLAEVRPWQPADRVTLAHSSGPKKVKEVLARMRISGDERATWPVVAWRGQILWMRGANLAPISGSPTIAAHPLH
ncbi:MAG TPA: tRNA lysidine(34) synthetase TilS [Acidobacteriaceae bacterium]|nr:tRNA lysidine(34) synthetase TilS [Acidobacteriaceae bacterium]